MIESRTIPAAADPAQLLSTLRTFFDTPLAWYSIVAAAESGDTRRITLQLRDRLRKAWKRRWPTLVYLTQTPTGNPSAVGNTVVWVTGTILETVLAGGIYRMLPDASGLLVFDLTITGGATRHVHAAVLGYPEASDPIAWT